jgi:endonuclease III
MALQEIVHELRRHYGAPQFPPARGPFELVIWENACYLLPDARRAQVFEGLRVQVGMNAEAIWKAPKERLLPLAKLGGMRPETRVFRWQETARIVLTQFDGDLDRILGWPYAEAKRALKLFPTIGDPGAEKILLFCGAGPGLPLDSNGLRVLTRIGYGRDHLRNYGATYRSVRDAIALELPEAAAARAEAHVLLREHGKTLCKTAGPACDRCPVAGMCKFAGAKSRDLC